MRLTRCLALLAVGTLSAAACAEGSSTRDHTTTGGHGGGGGAHVGGGGEGGALAPDGTSCDDGAACDSGFCVDGVCCQEACDALCFTCAGSDPGVCVPHDAGTDPDDECGQASCGGDGACQFAAHQWSKAFGGIVEDEIRDVAIDSAGNIIIVGEFNGTLDFDGTVLTTDGDDDGFAAKLDPHGNVLWAKAFGESQGMGGQAVRGVAVDGQDRVVIAGDYSVEIEIDGNVVLADGVVDLFVAVLDPDGGHVWSKGFGPTSAVLTARRVKDVAVDPSGNILVTGEFKGDIDFDGHVIDDGGGGSESTFLVKLNAAGVHQWSATYGVATSSDQGLAVATASNGDVVLCGFFNGTVNFGGQPLSAAGGNDIYVARFDANGNHAWSRRYGDTADQRCTALEVDAAGQVYFGGSMAGTVNFGGGDLSASDGLDAFVAQLDAVGGYVSAASWPGTGDQAVVDFAHDSLGHLVVTGSLRGSIDFGNGEIESANADDVFVGKLDPSGAALWSRAYGGIDIQVPVALAVSGDDLIVAVRFDDLIDFGGGELLSSGATDIAVARLGP